jgi:hypothetical protein
MIPHVLPVFPKEVVKLFLDIKSVFENIPQEKVLVRKSDSGNDRVISCHMICRALVNFFPVDCRDGYFVGKLCPHSWLIPKARWSIEPYFYERYIIDPYPWVAASGPILVYAFAHSPWKKIYQETDLPDVKDPDILRQEDVAKVSSLVREAIEKIKIKIPTQKYLSQAYVSKKDIKYKKRQG